MGVPRSTSSDARPVKADDAAIVAIITAICDEFEAYGYRRVGAEPRHRGIIVNCRRIRRLMREHGLQPKHYRRFVATTDSDHDSPIFPASPAAGSSMAQNSFGWRTPPTSPSRRALSIWRQVRQPDHAVQSSTRSAAPSCAYCHCGAENSYPNQAAADGLHPPRIAAICFQSGGNRGPHLFCGRRYRVKGRLDGLIAHGTGEMRKLKNTRPTQAPRREFFREPCKLERSARSGHVLSACHPLL